ncbi:hypothetical protein [Actinocorallia populi]|uniref:hypothetical protein n=1 Tax=Actinocorallia populi TaxID=2079200 RepID=UPI0013008549|nr:hypothetical protein [Actinocorallia populi]
MPLDLTGDDVTNRDLLGRVTLPLTGWTARLHHPDRLVLDPGGGSPLTYSLLGSAAPEQLLLRAHHVRLGRAFGPAGIDTVTLAYGVTGGGPAEPLFLRHRPWRPARVHEARPVTLSGRVWLAELPGHFDEVRVTADGHTAVRLV